MAQQSDNPFANIGLIAPVTQRDFYDQYCQTQTVGRANVDRTPFRRMVDLWFSGLSFAARKELEPANLKEKTFQFITAGEIFAPDSWQIKALMLIAIAVDGNVKIVQEPNCVMAIANGLAAAGVPYIVEMLREGDRDPIWNLSDALVDLLQSDIYPEENINLIRLSEGLR